MFSVVLRELGVLSGFLMCDSHLIELISLKSRKHIDLIQSKIRVGDSTIHCKSIKRY
jgi:hypothetical protein